MTYIKDIKLCVDCFFYCNEHGQKDRCINPVTTERSLVTGKEEFPYCFAQRQSKRDIDCGANAQWFVLVEETQIAREKARLEFEEAMRDSPF